MKRSPRPRDLTNLSDSINRQLNMYSLAATATGMGALALAQPAEAKVVYTPAHKWLPVNHYFYLDFNHDGRTAFRFFLGSRYSSVSNANYSLTVTPGSGTGGKNAVYSYPGGAGRSWAAALPTGVRVGPNSPFVPAKAFMFSAGVADDSRWSSGQWRDQTGHSYLGLKFVIMGKTHYGWARMDDIRDSRPVKALLTGYAYETIPNKAIITGKTKGPDVITVQPDAAPGSLGRLALGRN